MSNTPMEKNIVIVENVDFLIHILHLIIDVVFVRVMVMDN